MAVFSSVLLAAAITIGTDQAPLRSGCDTSDDVVAKVPAGSPVEIRFAMSGATETCYKVAVTANGSQVTGYVPASSLKGLDTFQQGLRDAPSFDVSKDMQKQVAGMQATAVNGPADHPLVKASKLLNDHQPQAALEIVERAMRTTGRDAQYLKLAGIAAYESDQGKKALDYLKESQQLSNDPAVAAWIARLQQEVGNDRSGEKLYGNRFVLRYEGGVLDADVARTMVSILEDEFARVSLQLGCRADDRIVTIVQSASSYRATTGAAEWSGGQYDGKIRVPVLETKTVSPQTRQVFAHEIVHACLSNMGQWPAWLQEGMAQKYSGEAVHPVAQAAVKAAIHDKKLPPLSQMGSSFSQLGTQQAMLAYAYARLAADVMVERYSAYGIQNVLRNPSRLPQVEAEVDHALRGE